MYNHDDCDEELGSQTLEVVDISRNRLTGTKHVNNNPSLEVEHRAGTPHTGGALSQHGVYICFLDAF